MRDILSELEQKSREMLFATQQNTAILRTLQYVITLLTEIF